MNGFTYEEQNNKNYLVYQMQAEEGLDRLTLEMMANNRIEGLIPLNYTQVNDSIYIKYDITGLDSLRKYLQGVVNRGKLLGVLESIADAAMAAEEYMLKLSSYVLDEEYIYVDSAAKKVFMIVLPVIREETSVEVFLKELLTDIQYDQKEDCSYVISLINLLGSSHTFTVDSFKEQVLRLKTSGIFVNNSKGLTVGTGGRQLVGTLQNEGGRQLTGVLQHGVDGGLAGVLQDKGGEPPAGVLQNRVDGPPVGALQDKGERRAFKFLPDGGNGRIPVSVREKEEAAHELERKQALDVLFSNEGEEEPKREKKGLFFRKEKSEKPEKSEKQKKGFWGRLSGSKKDSADTVSDIDSVMGGIAIPGMDSRNQAQRDMSFRGKTNGLSNGEFRDQDIAIPTQNVEINKKAVEFCDFGETVFIGEGADDEETFIIGQEQSIPQPEFILHRPSTNESFRISEEVTRIGRSASIADICISGNRGIGRVHALLYIQNGQVFIADNHSKNKTYVDGKQLDSEEVPRRLEHGSKIRLGDEELEFHIQE